MSTSLGFGSVRNIHHSNSSLSTSTNDALLTVFQADPLAYLENDGFHPVPVLDLESERQLLTESLTDNYINVDVSFDIATTERLGRFLARGEGRVLHFSGHGHPEYLAVENGWGAMHMIPVNDLRDLIQAGGEALKFVFVSACYSRSTGNAFLEAGVKHVVCCQQDDQPVLNVSCVIFARAFYQALASGRVLRQAFDLAFQQVVNCPHLDRAQRLEEAKKFVLLPEGADHDVIIFEPSYQKSPNLRRTTHSHLRMSRFLPVPPHVFTGRQVETYRVLDGLKSARVVRVTGPAGVGKCGVVQKACRYILDRQESCMRAIGEILWLPAVRNDVQDDISRMISAFSTIFNGLDDEEDFDPCHQKLLRYLCENKALIVFDVRRAKSIRCLEKIAAFMHDVIYHTNNTRVIIIHHIGEGIIQKLPCKELTIYLDPLDFLSTIRLFGKLCQFVADRRHPEVSNSVELCNLILPEGSPNDKPRSRRGRDIFRMVGEGLPDKIHFSAKNMTEGEYYQLIALGKRKEQVLEYGSRSALEKELSELSSEVAKAVDDKRWHDAEEYQHRLDEMEILREKLHDLPTLKSLASSLECDLQLANSARDYSSCAKLQQELDAVEEKIRIEKLAMEELGIEADDTKLPAQKKFGHETRVDLELEISQLDCKLEKACDDNDFVRVRQLDAQIKLLQEWRVSLPTRDELIAEMKEIQGSLKQAKSARDWDLAESLYGRVQGIQKQIDAESKALSRLPESITGKTSSDFGSSLPGAVAVASKLISARPQRSALDPHGEHVDEVDSKDFKGISGLPVAFEVGSPCIPVEASVTHRLPCDEKDEEEDDKEDDENEEETDYVNNHSHAMVVATTSYNGNSRSQQHDSHFSTQAGITSRQLQLHCVNPSQAAAQIGPVVQARATWLRSIRAAAQIGRAMQTRPSPLRSIKQRSGNPTRQHLTLQRSESVEERGLEETLNGSHRSKRLLESGVTAELHDEHSQDAPVSLQVAAIAAQAVENQIASIPSDFSSNTNFSEDPPSCGFMPLRQDNGDGEIVGIPMGHMHRLVLEQMIQESIANMAVPAVTVETVGALQRQKKKKIIRTLFGMRKGLS